MKSVLHYKKLAMGFIIAAGIIGLMMAVGFLTDLVPRLAGEDGDTASAPTPFVHYLTGENAAVINGDSPAQAVAPSGEEDFAAMLVEEWTANGYEALSYAQYEMQYTYALVPLTAAPDGYQNIDYVFVRPDPGMPDCTMITQVLYNYSEQVAIIIHQEENDVAGSLAYYYSDIDECGEPLGNRHWFSYRAGYGGTVNGTYINLLLHSAQNLGAESCQLMLQSLWPEG